MTNYEVAVGVTVEVAAVTDRPGNGRINGPTASTTDEDKRESRIRTRPTRAVQDEEEPDG